jgi:hypothetical protein
METLIKSTSKRTTQENSLQVLVANLSFEGNKNPEKHVQKNNARK